SSATTTASRSTACCTTSRLDPSVTVIAHHAVELLPREPGRNLCARGDPVDRALTDAQRAELLPVAPHLEHDVGVQHHLRGRDAHLNVVPRHCLPPIVPSQAYETGASVPLIRADDRGASVAIPQPREVKV